MRLALACAALLSACALPGEFHCASDAQCGAAGRCEATGDCSFVDGSCAGGRRYGHWARADLADACVGASSSCAGLLLCDGFDGSISPTWMQVGDAASGSVSVETDPAHVHRGSGSLKVHVEPGAFVEVGLAKPDPPLPEDLVYVRLFVQVPSGFAGRFVNTPRLLDYSQAISGYGDVGVGLEDSAALTVATHSPVVAGPDATSTAQLALDAWQCLELQVKARTDATSDSFARLLVGDAPAASVTPIQVASDQPLSELDLGVAGQLKGTSPFELWIDDVAVDDKPIGCAR